MPGPRSGGSPSGQRRREQAAVYRPPVQRARPPVDEEPSILGLSRRSRGRVGSQVFTLFFVAVFALIAAQLVFSLLRP